MVGDGENILGTSQCHLIENDDLAIKPGFAIHNASGSVSGGKEY